MLTKLSNFQIPSTFKIKGTAIINLKKYIQSKRDATYFTENARAVNLIKTDLILPSTWYEASAFIHLQMLVAKDFGMSDKEFALDSARFIVEEDLNGIYKFFMKLSGTNMVLGKLPQMNNAYSNFIKLSTIENKKGYFLGKHETPKGLCEWNQNGIEGAVRAITKLCGQHIDLIKVTKKEDSWQNQEAYQTWTFEVKYS